MKVLLWIVITVVCLLDGFAMGRQHRPPAVYTNTVTYVDTQRVAYPVPRDSMVIRYITVTLPASFRHSIVCICTPARRS